MSPLVPRFPVAGWRARARCAAGAAGTVLLFAACAAETSPGPEHVRLARGFRLSLDGLAAPMSVQVVGDGARLRVERAGENGLWIDASVPAEAWNPMRVAGLWSASRPFLCDGAPEDGSPAQAMSGAGRRFDPRPFLEMLRDLEAPVPGTFCAHGDRVYAVGDADGVSPGDVSLREYLSLGEVRDGVHTVDVGPYSGEGIPVFEGLDQRVRFEAPEGSVLRFATTALAPASRSEEARITFRISRDGVPLFEHTQALERATTSVPHEVALPPGTMHDLIFSVQGGAAVAAFHRPVAGPRDVGSYGARPWGEQRPDVLLFIADTFRADNMAFYGGDAELTPELNRFAEESVRFRHAHAPSTWTLPSHASMFCGLHPHQLGVLNATHALPPDAATVAGVLRAAGYRTGAITDQGYVSRNFGLSNGFEWFDERLRPFEETVEAAAAFLDADDGRPVFLLVHSYLVHVPYEPSPEASAVHSIEASWKEVSSDPAPGLIVDWHPGHEPAGEDAERMEQLEALYRACARDLDAGFGDLRDELEARRFLPGAYVIVTSDHGEAFWEHGRLGHGSGVYNETLRVPLLIHGPDLKPRAVTAPVGLVDLAMTISALTGVEPHALWLGQSLLDADAADPVFAFDCAQTTTAHMALVEGQRKLVLEATIEALERGSIAEAYDVESDPAEHRDRSGDPWTREILDRHRDNLRGVMQPSFEGASASPNSEQLEALKHLGY